MYTDWQLTVVDTTLSHEVFHELLPVFVHTLVLLDSQGHGVFIFTTILSMWLVHAPFVEIAEQSLQLFIRDFFIEGLLSLFLLL